MIGLPAGTRIWIAAGVTDMRCGFNSLAAKIQTALEENPFSGHVFVFRDRRGDIVKLLWWMPGKPWYNGFVESFNGKMRDECLSREWFRDLREARAVIESWRELYNQRRPHSALGDLAPAQLREQRCNIAVHLTCLTDYQLRTQVNLLLPQLR